MWFASQARTRRALEACGLGTFELDIATGEMAFGRLVRDQLGIAVADHADLNTLLGCVHDADRAAVHHAFLRALFEGGDMRLHFRVLGSNDVLCHLRARTFADADGRPHTLVGVTQRSERLASQAA